MTGEERARHYAALFAQITATGRRDWRLCVPLDGRVSRGREQVRLDDWFVTRREDGNGWDVTPAVTQ